MAVLVGCGAGSSLALQEEFVDTSSFLVKVCVYIEFYYPDGSYGGYATSRGTGLLVGANGVMQGVVTNASVCSGEHLDAFADELVEEHGFGGYNIGVPQIIPDGNDNIGGISGNIVLTDENSDVAVLELASPLYVYDTLKVRSFSSLLPDEQIYSACYAEVSDNVYELSFNEGLISDFEYVDTDDRSYTFIYHNAPISQTAQGGFILDGDGAVVGLISDKAEASTFGGSYAASMYGIWDSYLYLFGWDDVELTDTPEDVIVAPNGTYVTIDPEDSGFSFMSSPAAMVLIVLLVVLALFIVMFMALVCTVFVVVAILILVKVIKSKRYKDHRP